MSLVGIDIGSMEDMTDIRRKHKIGLFQISAKHIQDEESIEQVNHNVRIVVHYSYSINLGRLWNESDWWIQRLISEIKAAHKIGAWCIVVHTGKSLTNSAGMAINNMYSSLLYIHSKTIEQSSLKILLETPAGQGSEVLTKIEDFARFMTKFYVTNKELTERFGVCIDTCHVYAAGHDISRLQGIESLFTTLSKSIGLDKIKLIHLNNSRGELGSMKDRHAPLDSGAINLESINTIVRFVNRLEIPMVLETPMGDNYKSILNDYMIVCDIIKGQ